MPGNLQQFTRLLCQKKFDAFLVTNDIDIKYLTGFDARDSWLLVSPKRSFYITDARYSDEAKKALKTIVVQCYKHSIGRQVFQIAVRHHLKKIAFDDRHLNLYDYKQLRKCCPKSLRLFSTRHFVENLRVVKNSSEIAKIKKALQIHRLMLHYLKKILKPKITERMVRDQLENFVKNKGARFSFEPIIASGPNSSFPHATVTNRKITTNGLVLVDMGIDWEGYKSDLTRIFFLGTIPKSIKRNINIIKETQAFAVNLIKPGVKASFIDQEARKYLRSKGLDKYFIHSLGHGIGLEVHENPRLSPNSPDTLQDGMVVTVEPAIYFPYRYGIRIEDMVLVTKKGRQILSDDID